MRYGNPNLPDNPYSVLRPRGGVNNPQTYAQQRNAGQLAYQPNRAGYGGGTNSNPYGRASLVIPPPAPDPVVTTPGAPTPPPPLPWWRQASPNGLVTMPNGTVYNQNAVPGGNTPVQMLGGILKYTSPNGLVGYVRPQDYRSGPSSWREMPPASAGGLSRIWRERGY